MFDTRLIGSRIAELRKSKNMTQMELADAMGVSYQAVSNWERGNSLPDILKLPELSNIFACSIDDIIGNSRETKLMEHVIRQDVGEYVREQEITKQEAIAIAPLLKPSQTEAVLKEVLQSEQFEPEEMAQQDEMQNEIIPLNKVIWDTKGSEETRMQQVRQEKELQSVRKKKLSSSELLEIAPFVGREFLAELLAEEDEIDLELILSLAPFLGRENLAPFARQLFDRGDMEAIAELAPFLEQDILEQLVEWNMKQGNFYYVKKLAPFLCTPNLSGVVEQLFQMNHFQTIAELAPFLEQQTLSDFAKILYAKREFALLNQLIPFLPQELIQEIAKSEAVNKNFNNIKMFYPFLQQDFLAELLKMMIE